MKKILIVLIALLFVLPACRTFASVSSGAPWFPESTRLNGMGLRSWQTPDRSYMFTNPSYANYYPCNAWYQAGDADPNYNLSYLNWGGVSWNTARPLSALEQSMPPVIESTGIVTQTLPLNRFGWRHKPPVPGGWQGGTWPGIGNWSSGANAPIDWSTQPVTMTIGSGPGWQQWSSSEGWNSNFGNFGGSVDFFRPYSGHAQFTGSSSSGVSGLSDDVWSPGEWNSINGPGPMYPITGGQGIMSIYQDSRAPRNYLNVNMCLPKGIVGFPLGLSYGVANYWSTDYYNNGTGSGHFTGEGWQRRECSTWEHTVGAGTNLPLPIPGWGVDVSGSVSFPQVNNTYHEDCWDPSNVGDNQYFRHDQSLVSNGAFDLNANARIGALFNPNPPENEPGSLPPDLLGKNVRALTETIRAEDNDPFAGPGGTGIFAHFGCNIASIPSVFTITEKPNDSPTIKNLTVNRLFTRQYYEGGATWNQWFGQGLLVMGAGVNVDQVSNSGRESDPLSNLAGWLGGNFGTYNEFQQTDITVGVPFNVGYERPLGFLGIVGRAGLEVTPQVKDTIIINRNFNLDGSLKNEQRVERPSFGVLGTLTAGLGAYMPNGLMVDFVVRTCGTFFPSYEGLLGSFAAKFTVTWFFNHFGIW